MSGLSSPSWQLPAASKSSHPKAASAHAGQVHPPPSIASLYPQVITTDAPILAHAGFSAAARKAQEAQHHTHIHPHPPPSRSPPPQRDPAGGHPIPPTVTYPKSTLLQTNTTTHTNTHNVAASKPPHSPAPILSPVSARSILHSPPPPLVASSRSNTGTAAAAGAVNNGGGAGSYSGGSLLSTSASSFAGGNFGSSVGTSLAGGLAGSGGVGGSLLSQTAANSIFALAATNTHAHIGGVGHALQLHAQATQAVPAQQQKVSLDVGQPLNALTCSPDRTHLAVGGKEVKIIAHSGGKFMPVKHLNTNSKTPTALSDIQWHPLESYKHWLVTAPTNGKILLYHLNSKDGLKRAERLLDDHERTVNRIVWHPNQGDILFSGSQDGTVKMFDLRNSGTKAVQSFADVHSVRDVQVNPFNHNIFAAAYENGSMQIWDVRKGDFFHTIQAHQGLILTLDWHPEDKDILASGGVDRAIKVWNIGASVDKVMGIHSTAAASSNSATHHGAANNSGGGQSTTNQTEPLHTIQTIASVGRIKWRPSGKYPFQIASSANLMDCRIHLWNVHRPYVPLVSLLGHKDVISGFYWSDMDSRGQLEGMELISCSKDSTIQQHFLYIDHSIHTNYSLTEYPNQHQSTSAVAWNVHGSIATVNDQIDRHNRIKEADVGARMPGGPAFSFTAFHPHMLGSATVSGLKATSIQQAVLASILGSSGQAGSAHGASVTGGAGSGGGPEPFRNGFIRIFHASTTQQQQQQQQTNTSPIDHDLIIDSPQRALSEEEAFVYFARHYKFTSNPAFTTTLMSQHDSPCSLHGVSPTSPPDDSTNFVTLALHNSEVARSAHHFELSQIWAVLVQLLGPGQRVKEEIVTGPPPLPIDETHNTSTQATHTQATKKSTDTSNSNGTGAATNTIVLPTTYVPPQSHNPSTALHHRLTAPPPVGSIDSDGRDAHISQYLQVQLVDPTSLNSVLLTSPVDEPKMKDSIDSNSITSAVVVGQSQSPSSSSAQSPTHANNANAILRSPDPTQTISALNRADLLIDCLPTIHKSHCYTLHNPLPPSRGVVGSLLNPYNSGLSILASSSFQATLLNSFLEYTIERGDVQTCVAVISLLKEFHPNVILAMDLAEKERERLTKGGVGGILGHSINDRFKLWYWSYIDLLQRHELYSHASEIIQLCNDVDLKKMNQKSTTISLICPVCKHASQQVGVGCTNKMCTKTRMTNCSICQLSVTGVYCWCQGCGHGGHMSHMQDWFSKHSFCPTGCLHRCVELVTMPLTQQHKH